MEVTRALATLAALLLLSGAAPAQNNPTPCPAWLAAKSPLARAAWAKLGPTRAADLVAFARAGHPARLGRGADAFYALVAERGAPALLYVLANREALAAPAAWDALGDAHFHGEPPAGVNTPAAGTAWPYLAGGAALVLIVLFRPRGAKR